MALKVYTGRSKQNGMLEQAYKDLRSELSIATQLRHPRIAMVTGVSLNPLGMMQQLAPLGSLRQHIAKCPCGMQSGIVHSVIGQVNMLECINLYLSFTILLLFRLLMVSIIFIPCSLFIVTSSLATCWCGRCPWRLEWMCD